MAVRVASSRVKINQGELDRLTTSRLGPFGRDLERRAIRVTRRMKANASGRPGPNIRTRNLYEAIGLLMIGLDGEGLFAQIGVQQHRAIRRGWNYPILLEFGHGSTPAYPFMARSLEAAAD